MRWNTENYEDNERIVQTSLALALGFVVDDEQSAAKILTDVANTTLGSCRQGAWQVQGGDGVC